MLCPACKTTNLVKSDRQGVEIDYCPDCRGVWLDRGELDKIIERSAAYAEPAAPRGQPMPAPGRGEYAGDRRDHRPYKKKSLLGELFDF